MALFKFCDICTIKRSTKARRSLDTGKPFNGLTFALAKKAAMEDMAKDRQPKKVKAK